MHLSAALGVLIGAGGSARLSILLGAKDFNGARRTLCSSLILLLIIVCCYLCCFAIFIDEILIAFGASEVTLPYARDFMIYILPGRFMTNFAFTFNNFMRASGYPVKAMITMLIGAGCNLILAPIFIFYLDMGIKGAAIATDISMMISAYFVLSHFFSSKSTLHFTKDRDLYKLTVSCQCRRLLYKCDHQQKPLSVWRRHGCGRRRYFYILYFADDNGCRRYLSGYATYNRV